MPEELCQVSPKLHYVLQRCTQTLARLIIFTFYKIPKCQLDLTRGIGSSPSCEQHLKLIILLTIISREVSEKGGYARDTCETRKIRGTRRKK